MALQILEKFWMEGEQGDWPMSQYNQHAVVFAGVRRPGRMANKSIGGKGLRWRMVASPADCP